MENENEEKYVFLRFATGDLEQAIRGLKELLECPSTSIKYALLRDSIVAYCRPFTKCRGKFHKQIRLETEEFVPSVMAALHAQLIELRDQTYAHTDLEPRRPVLHMWRRPQGNIFPIQFKGYDYEGTLSKRDQLVSLFESVLHKIEKKLVQLEKEFAQSV
jgi:hypothetical protein